MAEVFPYLERVKVEAKAALSTGPLVRIPLRQPIKGDLTSVPVFVVPSKGAAKKLPAEKVVYQRVTRNTPLMKGRPQMEATATNPHGSFFNRFGILGTIVITVLMMMLTAVVTTLLMYVLQVVQAKGMQIQLEVAKQAKELDLMSAKPEAHEVGQQVKMLPTFSCENKAQKDEGFAKADVQQISQQGKQYSFSSGCASVRVGTHVQNLSGSKYVFQQEVSPGNYWGCGNGLGGRNDSPQQCADFLNARQGQNIQLIIGNGGVVSVN